MLKEKRKGKIKMSEFRFAPLRNQDLHYSIARAYLVRKLSVEDFQDLQEREEKRQFLLPTGNILSLYSGRSFSLHGYDLPDIPKDKASDLLSLIYKQKPAEDDIETEDYYKNNALTQNSEIDFYHKWDRNIRNNIADLG